MVLKPKIRPAEQIRAIKRTWIVISRSGYPDMASTGHTRKESIRKFCEVLAPLWYTPWEKYELMGYRCKRVDIEVTLDQTYNR